MKNNKFKLISILFTITLFGFTTNISAMENKIEEEKNIKNEIIENEDDSLKKQQQEENFELRKINEYFLDDIKNCKKRIYYFKINQHEEDELVYQKEKHNDLKKAAKLRKKNYEKILNSNIEKNKESKKLIKQIDSNIEEYNKYIEIIDKKFKNYEDQNEIDENKKIEFEEEDLKILKEEIINSYDSNKKCFFNYINSISKIEPIEKLKENKTIFEKSCNETINLMKKFDDMNRFCNEFNEIKEEIKDIIENFLIFYFKTTEYIFYSFLERVEKTNPGKNEIDKNFATKYGCIKDIFESKIENLDELKIPEINSFLDEIKIKKFNLPEKFLLEKENINNVKPKPTTRKLEELQNKLKDFNNHYNKTKNAFLTHIINEDISKNPLNDNFEINKKFMSSLNNKNYIYLYEELFKKLTSPYEICNKAFNHFIYFDPDHYKHYNILDSTKKELDEMKNSYLEQYLNTFEFDVDSYLKLAIDNFYESFPQQKKENKNEDEIFPHIDNFFDNYKKAEENCYKLNRVILSINRHNKIEKDLKEKEEKLQNYTMLLRGYGKDPFLNLLTENLNLKDDKKILESLKFKAKMNSYKTKIDFFLKEMNRQICALFETLYFKNINNMLKIKITTEQTNDFKEKIIKKQENLFKEFSFLLNECKEYIYKTSKELIEKNNNNNTEIYEEEALKTQVYKILKFIDNIEQKNSDQILEYDSNQILEDDSNQLLKDIVETLKKTNKTIKNCQEILKKKPRVKFEDERNLTTFIRDMIIHINTIFKKYINYTAIIPTDKNINSLFEESLKEIEEKINNLK